MSHSLSDQENVGLGVFAALVEAICLQPTLYWKNARAQGLPFTLNPRMIYRGTTMSMINEMQMMGVQFGTTGFLQRMWLTYVATNSSSNSSISLSMSDELGLSCLGGAISAIPTCPVEVIMINQQKTGRRGHQIPIAIRPLNLWSLYNHCLVWPDDRLKVLSNLYFN